LVKRNCQRIVWGCLLRWEHRWNQRKSSDLSKESHLRRKCSVLICSATHPVGLRLSYILHHISTVLSLFNYSYFLIVIEDIYLLRRKRYG